MKGDKHHLAKERPIVTLLFFQKLSCNFPHALSLPTWELTNVHRQWLPADTLLERLLWYPMLGSWSRVKWGVWDPEPLDNLRSSEKKFSSDSLEIHVAD